MPCIWKLAQTYPQRVLREIFGRQTWTCARGLIEFQWLVAIIPKGKQFFQFWESNMRALGKRDLEHVFLLDNLVGVTFEQELVQKPSKHQIDREPLNHNIL